MQCRQCKQDKYCAQFSRHNTCRFGVRPECKVCQSANKKIYYHRNKVKILNNHQKYINTNPEIHRKISRAYYARNKQAEQLRSSAYAKANPLVKRAQCAKRRATLADAMPKWLSESQLLEIRLIYKNCPAGYEVDHIVPLRGKEVRGLHVPWNLQYLTVSENRSKLNHISS